MGRHDTLVGCFGCTRWRLGWPYRGLPFQPAFPDEEAVPVMATQFSKRHAHDIAGVEEHDSEGRRWFRPRKLRRHTFYLCSVCAWLWANDQDFEAQISKKACSMREGGESP